MFVYLYLFLFYSLENNKSFAKSISLKKNESVFVFDSSEGNKTKNWRSVSEAAEEDIKNLQCSGSAEFTLKGLTEIIEKTAPKKVIIVDLRREPHLFINGLGVSWYSQYNALNADKSFAEIESDEESRAQELRAKKTIEVHSIENHILKKHVTQARTVTTEKELVKARGAEYVRIPVSDHHKPTNDEVDRFIHFFKTLNREKWIHFHCAGGKGRTTLFMTMYDMMINANRMSRNDIIERQHKLGGSDLLKISQKDQLRQSWAKDRVNFLYRFYQYCKEAGPKFSLTWSNWIKRENKTFP